MNYTYQKILEFWNNRVPEYGNKKAKSALQLFHSSNIPRSRKAFILVPILFLVMLSGCVNPFAPALDESAGNSSSALSDQTTTDGVFQNFQYAYTFKDTVIYGRLISPDFIFTYHDYDQGIDVSWGRDDEMKTTYGLFQNSQRLDLIWNNIILSSSDSTSATIVRGFNLTITFNPTDVERIDGRVNMTLKKDPSTNKWLITKWIDESNF